VNIHLKRFLPLAVVVPLLTAAGLLAFRPLLKDKRDV